LDHQEKDQLIEKLLESDMTWDQICKEAHVSPNRIKKVRDRREQSLAPKVKSVRTRALEMYHKHRIQLKVATELDISPQDAETYQQEYWMLMGMADLAQVYRDNKSSIGPLINLHYELDARGLTVGQVFENLKKLNSIHYLESKKQALEGNVWLQQSRLRVLRQEISSETKKLGELRDANQVEQQMMLKEIDRNEMALELDSNSFEKIEDSELELVQKLAYGTGSSH
jgi:hypothetical protein